MKKIVAIILIPGILFLGCATTAPPPPKTQLQVRQFQTRTYDTADQKMVMKALLNAYQDQGFIVKNANTDLGLLTASREVDLSSAPVNLDEPTKKEMSTRNKWLWGAACCLSVAAIIGIAAYAAKHDNDDDDDDDDNDRGTHHYHHGSRKKETRKDQTVIIESSANVTVSGFQTKVRVNFQHKVLDNMGATSSAQPLEDAEYYRNFFAKVDKSIFLQKEKL